MSAVLYEVGGSVATVTLDAPARRNALSAPLLADLRAHLDAAEADPAVRSVVLSHTGTVFCSGMDLTAVTDVPADQQPITVFPLLLQQIWEFPKPVLARVAGKARAGGVGLIAVCDLALAVESADFALTEVRLGLVPAVVSVPLLARFDRRALLELCLTGETFTATAALAHGLLNRVLADETDLDAELARYGAMLALGEPKAVAATKAMLLREHAGPDLAEDYAAMGRLSAGFFAGPEAAEGIAAFAAKRPPSWVG